MTTAFPQPPIKVPVMAQDGVMSMEWVQWFSRAFSQIATAAYKPEEVEITGGSISNVTLSSIISIVCKGTIAANNLTGVNTGDQVITLTGDVAGGGTGSFTATIQAGAVTYAKMQAVSQPALLGATAAGRVAEIPLGAGLSFSGGTLTAAGTSGYSGTVTTAKLTTGGTNGSMTFVNGVLTSQVAAT